MYLIEVNLRGVAPIYSPGVQSTTSCEHLPEMVKAGVECKFDFSGLYEPGAKCGNKNYKAYT